jgi:hypothetical protein
MSDKIQNIPNECFCRLEKHTAGTELAIRNLENPAYRQKIVENLEREDFSANWTLLKEEMTGIDHVQKLVDIACKIADRYELLLKIVTAPDCVSFVEWLKGEPIFCKIGEKKDDLLIKIEDWVTSHYQAISSNFQFIPERLRQIDTHIGMTSIRNHIVRIFITRLSRIVQNEAEEKKVEERLTALFAEMTAVFDCIIELEWLKCNQDAFHLLLGYLPDKWTEKKRFVNEIYTLFNRETSTDKLDQVVIELKSLDAGFRTLDTILKKNPVEDNLGISGSETIWKHWIDNLKSVEEDQFKQPDRFFEDAFNVLFQTLDTARAVFDGLDEFQNLLNRNIEKKLTDIPQESSKWIRSHIKETKKVCAMLQKELLEQTKDMERLNQWLDERNSDIESIRKKIPALHKKLIESVENTLSSEEKYLIDLETLGSESMDQIRIQYEGCKETNGRLKAGDDSGKFFKTLNTFYNQINRLIGLRKEKMRQRLDDDDIQFLENLRQSPKISPIEMLKTRHDSILNLLECGLIQIDIKPCHS